jgi:hypothetical protein
MAWNTDFDDNLDSNDMKEATDAHDAIFHEFQLGHAGPISAIKIFVTLISKISLP